MNEINLTVTLYKENGVYGIYIGDNMGGSGITVQDVNATTVAHSACNYITDYLMRLKE